MIVFDDLVGSEDVPLCQCCSKLEVIEVLAHTRQLFIGKTLTNLFTIFSDVMLAYYAPDKTDAGIAAWLGKSEWKVRMDISPARRNYSGVKVMQILGEIRKTDAASKGVGGVRTPSEELLQDLIFFILH